MVAGALGPYLVSALCVEGMFLFGGILGGKHNFKKNSGG